MGKLVGTFGDFRATVLTIVGYINGAIGVIGLTDGIFRQNLREATEFALFWFVSGAVCFALAKFRYSNRLELYHDGFVQVKRGRVDSLLWWDVQQVHLDRVTYYGSGLAYKVRYQCSFQRGDGTWLVLDAIPITPEVMNLLRKTAGLRNIAGGDRGMQSE